MVAQLDREYLAHSRGRAVSRLLSYLLFEGRPLTTRGQWINPVLRRFLEGRIKAGPTPFVDRPVFIVGTGRSGTTLLGRILSVHPSVGFLNEPKLLWNMAVPDEDLIGSYSTGPARVELGADDFDERAQHRLASLYSAYLSITRNMRVVDKYPELVFRIPFVASLFGDGRFLLIVRRGDDTCRSVTKWSDDHGSREAAGFTDWWGLENRKWHLLVEQCVSRDASLGQHRTTIAGFSRPEDMAATEWILAMKAGLAAAQARPHAVHLLRYEELTADPVAVLSRLCEFCELPESQRMLEFATGACKPAKSGPPLEVHPVLQEEFRRLNRELGYSEG